jgi:O-antigen ligase
VNESVGPPRPTHAYIAVLAAGCALFAWLMPTHQPPWMSFHAELAMAGAAALLWAWMLVVEQRGDSTWPWAAIACATCAVIPAGQWAAGLIAYRADALISMLYLLGAGLAVAMGSRAVQVWGSDRPLAAFAWTLVIAGLASTWLALYQWLQLDYMGLYTTTLPPGGRAGANLNQPNLLATLLMLCVAAVAVLRAQDRLSAPVAILLLAVYSFGLAMTQSRTGGAEALVLAGWLLIKRRSLPARLGPGPVLLSTALLLAMIPLWAFTRDALGSEAGRSLVEVLSGGTRSIHWASMADAILRRPWTGYGWNQVVLAQFDVAPAHAASLETISYSHNGVLDLLVWNGIPLGLVLVLSIVGWGWVVVRRTVGVSSVLALGMVATVVLHALLEYPLHYSFFLLPIGMLAGGLCTALMPRAASRVGRGWTLAVMMLVGAGVVVLTRDYSGLEADFRAIRLEQARVGLEHGTQPLSQPWMLDHLAAYLRFSRNREHEGMSDAELAEMRTVVRRFPSGPNLVRYASALMLNRQPQQAVDVLRRVCKMEEPQTCTHLQRLWARLGELRNAPADYVWPAD